MFDKKRAGGGTREWSEETLNIQKGCPNDCLYCYAAANAATRYGGWRPRAEWAREELTKRASLTSYPLREGVIMMPSTHDITPFNVDAFCRVACVVAGKGNHLLIVSKPNRACMAQVMDALEPWKDQVQFRFTIGAIDQALTSFWEPGAPHPLDRLDTLADAERRGFQRSVSIEPMLAGVDETMRVVENVAPWGPETVWVGKMNGLSDRVDLSNPLVREAVQRLEHLQRDDEILRLHDLLAGVPFIRWKKSIQDVMAKHGRAAGL